MTVVMNDDWFDDEFWGRMTEEEFRDYMDSLPEPDYNEPLDPDYSNIGKPWPMSVEKRSWLYFGEDDYYSPDHDDEFE